MKKEEQELNVADKRAERRKKIAEEIKNGTKKPGDNLKESIRKRKKEEEDNELPKNERFSVA